MPEILRALSLWFANWAHHHPLSTWPHFGFLRDERAKKADELDYPRKEKPKKQTKRAKWAGGIFLGPNLGPICALFALLAPLNRSSAPFCLKMAQLGCALLASFKPFWAILSITWVGTEGCCASGTPCSPTFGLWANQICEEGTQKQCSSTLTMVRPVFAHF